MSGQDATPDAVTQREIAETLRSFAASTWRSMTLEVAGIRITVDKDGAPAPTAAPEVPVFAPAPTAAPARATLPAQATAPPPATSAPLDTTGLIEIRSPAVGAFWLAPSPGSAPFVAVGQIVEVDEQLAIVEVMKLMNPVVAPQAGEIVAVCAANAEMVEYEQVVFLLRPSHG